VIEQKRPMWMELRYPPGLEPVRYVIRDPSEPTRFLGNAGSLVRRVNTSRGKLAVLGLLDVATAAAARGRGYGEALVRAAWSRVDDGTFDFSLFQTIHARAFY